MPNSRKRAAVEKTFVGISQTSHVAARLSHFFSRHMLVLQLAFNKAGTPIIETFTGFRLYIGADIWITAAHVIQRIEELRRQLKLVGAHLLDFCKSPGAEGIPVNLDEMCLDFASEAEGLDIGWGKIPPYYSGLLNANPSGQPLTERVWRGREHVRPDAYYLVGAADELTRSGWVSAGGRDRFSSRVGLGCIPISLVNPPRDRCNDDFWNKPHSIFASVLPLADQPKQSIRNVRGMSGGPIFGVRDDGTQMRYWLYGIQSSWLPSSRIIRATEIDPLAAAIEEASRSKKHK